MLPPHAPGVTRRTFLTAVGVATVGAASGALTIPGPADARGHTTPGGARFAVVTDTHVNLSVPDRTERLARVMRHIAGRHPDFVLNCGDIGDYGVAEEFEAYRSAIPDELVPLLHQVPGNHEAQWNADAWAAYHHAFGPAHHSFDAAGLHMVAMDPLVSQEWPAWQFSKELLEFIEDDLRRVPRGTPIVLFNHFPLSDDWFYVYNAELLLELIQPYDVRVAFAGHTHKRQLHSFNGLTQVVGNAIINSPVYYWAERVTDADGDRLVVSEVSVPATGEATQTVITEAPLSDPGPGGRYGPVHATASLAGATIRVDASIPRDSGVTQVATRLYPQGVRASDWVPLSGSGRQWNGELDASSLVPGVHRLQVQAGTGQDPVWDTMTSVTVPATSTRVAWTHDLHSETVMADLAHHEGLVVAATTAGVVDAFTAGTTKPRRKWRRTIGGVWKGPVFTPDGGTVLVGSADHHLYALDPKNGATAWRRDLGAPVQCRIAVLPSGDDHRIVVAAGETLHCLELDGTPVWQAALNGTFTGEACTDGTRVYAGSGDGNAYAFDASTGERVWASLVAAKTDNAYHRIIYGPWAAPMRMLPTGDVLVPMHTTISALDPASGDVRWTRGGLARVEFTPPTVTDYGALVFDGKTGIAYLLDPATGAVKWSDDTLPQVPGSGASWGGAPVPTGEPGRYWMASTSGLLTHIDLTDQKVTPLLLLSTAFSTSTAVVTGTGPDTVLVAVDHGGTVSGVVGLDA